VGGTAASIQTPGCVRLPEEPAGLSVERAQDLRRIVEYYFERGWSDGPLVVPVAETPAREFVVYVGRDPGQVVLRVDHLGPPARSGLPRLESPGQLVPGPGTGLRPPGLGQPGQLAQGHCLHHQVADRGRLHRPVPSSATAYSPAAGSVAALASKRLPISRAASGWRAWMTRNQTRPAASQAKKT
jgi:hypothetical protein